MEFRQKAPEGKPNNDDDNKNTTADTNTPPTGKSYRDKHSIILRNIDNPPEPYFSFERPEFPPFILDIIRANGFKAFTPVQAQGIPIIMSGRDFIGISKTGSGKTLAFLIPAIIHLIGQNRDSRDTSILVLSPTRELAMQIENEFKKFLSRSRITWACVYGGIKKDYQRNSLLRGVQILVATPGRLIDFIQEDSISVEHVSYFVLDEADRMLDMGFAPQIREILSHMKKSKQSLMFSATWPFEIKQLADRYLTNPVSLQIGILERTINDSIKQDIKIVSYRDKFRELQKDLLRTTERRLIFVQRKIDCERICENLLNEGEKCVSIHGDKVQIHRDKALMQFKTGKIRILVATDVASRGLDIPDVELVINYDFPKQIEDYIHRIGRTGRAGKKGETVSYLT
jgi:ATP-dependent RNA helicase DDX5/DBP2